MGGLRGKVFYVFRGGADFVAPSDYWVPPPTPAKGRGCFLLLSGREVGFEGRIFFVRGPFVTKSEGKQKKASPTAFLI